MLSKKNTLLLAEYNTFIVYSKNHRQTLCFRRSSRVTKKKFEGSSIFHVNQVDFIHTILKYTNYNMYTMQSHFKLKYLFLTKSPPKKI